ncbi:hypothetical protein AAC387_Pa10g1287 [Persea americana]
MGVSENPEMERGGQEADVADGRGGEEKENIDANGRKEEEKEGKGVIDEEKKVENEMDMSRLRTSNPVSTIQIQTPSPAQTRSLHIATQNTPSSQQETPSRPSMNSRNYTNRISLFLFLFHILVAVTAVGFLIYRAVEGLLQNGEWKRKEKQLLEFWLPQVAGSAIISVFLAWAWQRAFRQWPAFMVRFILWSSFIFSLTAGILLLCFSMAATDGVGIALIGFAVGNGLYTCWVTPRIEFAAKVIEKSLEPAAKFPDLNQPTYWLLAIGFMWMSVCSFAVIGALNFHFPPLLIIGLVLSLMWTTEVFRNVVNLTVCRAVSLYYLRGMQSTTQFCFQRAISRNLGSACLGSLFVPTIEALRIVARVLNLLKGEDEFMFSCAHCCLKMMEAIFRCGNGWAFVHIAAYGRSFVTASRTTWALFEGTGMEVIVDSDITSAICFLTGVASGSVCLIVAASWTHAEHKGFTATVSMLAFFIGYLLTRIGMAMPHACVSCYYVCYAENPGFRLFDNTIKQRIESIRAGRDVVIPTPRIPRPPII